ncbi:MAG: hypothetical protein IPK83_07785 [Planctomycetes bacterium]|nr:hypothetical protein [Planctomycetota bacterium]
MQKAGDQIGKFCASVRGVLQRLTGFGRTMEESPLRKVLNQQEANLGVVGMLIECGGRDVYKDGGITLSP